jgi:FkbM family methyltransferase
MPLLSNRARSYTYRAAQGTALYSGRKLLSAYASMSRGSTTLRGIDLYLEHDDRPGLRYTFEEIFIDEDYRFTAERANPYIIDGGSNAGVSVAYFKLLFPLARVLAFEPDPVSFASLQRNIARNGFTAVTTVNAALAEREGEIELYGRAGSVLATTVRPAEPSADGRVVEAVRLSAFVDEQVDLLKLDVQGAEYAVLAELEAANALHHVSQMVVEYHHHQSSNEDSLSEIFVLLERTGFGYQLAAARTPGRPSTPHTFQDVLVYAYRK